MAREGLTLRASRRVPQQRTAEPALATDPVPTGEPVEPVAAVPFDRLLSIAVLTPAQASLVAVQLLDAVQPNGASDGVPSEAACLGAVTVTPSGRVDVTDPLPGEGTRLTVLLEQLVQNARRLPTHPKPGQLSLLRRLEDVARDPLLDPGARARELEGALIGTLGPGALARLAGQLAALVDGFARLTPSAPSPTVLPAPGRREPAVARTDSPTGSPSVAPRAHGVPASPARPSSRPARGTRHVLHPRTRGRRLALIALLVVGALAISSYLVVRGPGSGILGALGNSPSAPATTAPPHPSTKAAPHGRQHRRQAAATLAPRHSGPVTGVTVLKTAGCAPGGLCPIKVTVRLRPASTARTIGWKVGAARLCTRGITWSAPTRVTAQAGWSSVYATSSVRVPNGRSLALVAVTTTPARAQSRPVPVRGSSLHC